MGHGVNLAVAPIFDRYGYPHAGQHRRHRQGRRAGQALAETYWLLGTGGEYAEALVEFLASCARTARSATTSPWPAVADGFGIELSNAGRRRSRAHGFKLVYDETYPLGTQDLAPIINAVKELNPDVFVAFSYPPDTFGLTAQAQSLGFNPKIFYRRRRRRLPDL